MRKNPAHEERKLIAVLLMAAAALPEVTECQGVTQDPAATIAFSTGLQGFIYGYPVVDMLKQMHNETHRVNADQPVVAPINQIVPYPHILTPEEFQERKRNKDHFVTSVLAAPMLFVKGTEHELAAMGQ